MLNIHNLSVSFGGEYLFEEIANSTVPSNAMNTLFNNFELAKFLTISIILTLYIFLY